MLLECDSTFLAISLGNYLKDIYLLKISLAIRTEDDRMKKEATDFKELYEVHWTAIVSSVKEEIKSFE